MDLDSVPVLGWVVIAAQNAVGVDEVWVATSTLEADDKVAKWCMDVGVRCFRGSESDVLERFYECAKQANADIVLRATGDCPFLDTSVIEQVVALREATDADYASNISPPTWPDGLDIECFKLSALKAAHEEATSRIDRDCVTQYLERNSHRFKHASLPCPIPGLHKERWVLDTENDLKFCRAVAERIKTTEPYSYLKILQILNKEPELRKINSMHPRNERFFEALGNAPITPREFPASKELLKRAEAVIPLAAQTFSKSKVQFPANNPLFLSHGNGAYVFDVDGHDYVDMMGALLPNILGYRDPDVDWAIRNQLTKGISFSLATELEVQLAEKLKSIIPCAEMSRFGKTGTDVTSAAVRLARAYTNRRRILSSGYHGWADWALGHDDMRGRGVPLDVKNLTEKFSSAHRAAVLETLHSREYACVILEPESNPGFLKELRDVCTQTGTVLIFDEIITGFRWHLGGAQTLFGVTPDLACFGKAMGNGMPISAIVGKREIMKLMEPPNNIFYSGTFFGETLSIAAALATINKLEAESVPQRLKFRNDELKITLEMQVAAHKLDGVVSFDKTPLQRISFSDHKFASKEQLGALFRQEMAQAGVLIVNANAFSLAHGPDEWRRVSRAYDHTFKVISDALKHRDIAKRIGNVALPEGSNVRS